VILLRALHFPAAAWAAAAARRGRGQPAQQRQQRSCTFHAHTARFTTLRRVRFWFAANGCARRRFFARSRALLPARTSSQTFGSWQTGVQV